MHHTTDVKKYWKECSQTWPSSNKFAVIQFFLFMLCKKNAWKKNIQYLFISGCHIRMQKVKSTLYINSGSSYCYIPTYKMGVKILVDLSDRKVKGLWKQINLFVRSNTQSWVHESWILTKKINLLPFKNK